MTDVQNGNELQYYKEKYQKYFDISNQNNIKNSVIHGLGVFANKDFVEGDLITRYPHKLAS